MTVFFNKIQILEVLYRENNHTNLMLNGLPRLVGLGLLKMIKAFGVYIILLQLA